MENDRLKANMEKGSHVFGDSNLMSMQNKKNLQNLNIRKTSFFLNQDS